MLDFNPDTVDDGLSFTRRPSINPLVSLYLRTIKVNEIQIKVSKISPTGQSEILTPADMGTSGIDGETIKIITNKIPQGEIWYIRSIQTINRITIESHPLDNLDTIRDKILLTAGDTVFDISNTAMSVKPFINFAKRKAVNNKLNTSDPQYGLCLKLTTVTYIKTG